MTKTKTWVMWTLSMLAAACGDSGAPSGTATGAPGIPGTPVVTPPSGSLGPGDGDSVYLNVVPPGSNGNSAGGVGVPVSGTPAVYPSNFTDQATLYGDLAYAKRGMTTAACKPPTSLSAHVAASTDPCNYFKHAGLEPDTVVSTETVTAASGGTVTIRRDGWGVPFITAANRSDAMFGFGYAEAEDRLWLLDILRNVGRGTVSKFLGPAPLFYQLDAGLSVTAGYSDDELAAIVEQAAARFGDVGKLLLTDVDANVAGINAYIATLTGANVLKTPPEYLALKNGGLPVTAFTRSDIVASAILVQSLFAVGGGSENVNELLLQQLDPSFTAGSTTVSAAACRFWRDMRHADDPQATRTLNQGTFRQSPAALDESCPMTLPAGVAIWDVGSYQTFTTYSAGGVSQNGGPTQDPSVVRPGGGAAKARARSLLKTAAKAGTPSGPRHAQAQIPAATTLTDARRALRAKVGIGPYEALRKALAAAGFGLPNSMSNWQAITAAHSASGHPIGIMGPQASYYAPELEWEASLRSTGGTPQDFNGRGITIGSIPYIVIGRGTDYGWSATSGDSDLIDTRVSKLCNTNGTPATLTLTNGFPNADGYLFDQGDGKGPLCRRLYKRTDTWTAVPTVASLGSSGGLLPQTVNRYILRTHYGPVFALATVGGAPVAISTQRSTFYGELDTAIPFALATTPTVKGAQSFIDLFNGITGTFNWLYVDQKDVGYIQSGLLPVRDPQTMPDLPAWGDGRFDWASDKNLPADFFTKYGGSVPFPGRVVAQSQNGGPLAGGYTTFKDFLPFESHPQVINPDQGYLLSWNNSPAKGWWAADNRANWGPVHRVDALQKRYDALFATGRKLDFANIVEANADASFVDLRGQELLPLLIQLMQKGALTADQTQVVTLMQQWQTEDGSLSWINGGKGLGAWRRARSQKTDSNGDTQYDSRAQAVLMDAWYQHLVTTVTAQLAEVSPDADAPGLTYCESNILLCRYDGPRQQGSAYEFGWFQVMQRMLQTVLGTPGHTDYRSLKCAGTGTVDDCRNAVLTALDSALSDLGGLSNIANWDGTQLSNPAGKSKVKVEAYDAITFSAFSLLPVPDMPWSNRPTYQQVIEVRSGR